MIKKNDKNILDEYIFSTQVTWYMNNFVFGNSTSFSYTSDIAKAPFWVTHTQSWVNIIEKTFPHITGFMIADNHTIDSDSSFLPLYCKKGALNRKSWLSIPYATVSDPVLQNEKTAGLLIKALIGNPKIVGPVEIRTQIKIEDKVPYSVSTEYLNHQIRLNGDDSEIFKRMHKNSVQIPIRKSLDSGLSLKIGTTIDDIECFYKIYVLMRKEQGLPPQPLRFFKNMWMELSPLNNVELLLAEKDGKVIAGLFNLKKNWLYSFEYIAKSTTYDKFNCAHFLFWQGIQRAISQHMQFISFARTSSRNKGLCQFKERWGTEVVPYYDYIYPASAMKHREDSFCYRMIKKYAKKLPAPVFRFLGEMIYRLI